MKTPDHSYSTIEELENDNWGFPEFDSHLVVEVHSLRRKPLREFTTGNLRMMIGQEVGLNYLVPIALSLLSMNLFAEGDFYEGDLLQNVLTMKKDFWEKNNDYWNMLHCVIKDRTDELIELEIDTEYFYKAKPAGIE